MRHGGKILVGQIEAQGVDTVFTVPGESFLAVLDGLHDSKCIRTIICRQEGGASMMAEAYGKLTGRPGVCMVTRGPGAANAMSGLHVAQQDSTPLVMIVGLPAQDTEDRDAFQEIDVKRLFSSFVKWAAVIRDVKRVPEYISRAFHVAGSGRPGPVVLGVPEDMLVATADITASKPAQIAFATPDPLRMEALATRLAQAKRPVMIVGGPGWSGDIQGRVEAFVTRFDLPVAAALRNQDYIDNRHPCYVGHAGIGIDAKLGQMIKDADLLLVMGARLGEMTTQAYTLLSIPNPDQFLVHIHPAPDEIGTVYRADLGIAASADSFSRGLETLSPPEIIPWSQLRHDARAAYEAYCVPLTTPGDVKMEQIVSTLSALLPADAIVTNGAGNYAGFVHRYFTYKGYRTQLAPTSGSMGYGLPAAISAKIAFPRRPVVAFAGDGCFMMTSQELATAVQYGLPIIIIIANNAMYGTIRMHQEREYPGRVMATTLVNPDFAAMARSFGAHGETIRQTEEFGPAIGRALEAQVPTVIELKLDSEALTPKQTLSEIRQSR